MIKHRISYTDKLIKQYTHNSKTVFSNPIANVFHDCVKIQIKSVNIVQHVSQLY